jgi:hypothetical protein
MVSRPVCRSVGLPSGAHDQILFFCLTIAGFLMWGASLTRGWICNLLVQLLLCLARAVTLGSKYSRTHDHILLSHLRLPQPEGTGPSIHIPQEQDGLVIPRPLCSLFVASYDSQGYGGGILTRLHTGHVVTLVSVTVKSYVTTDGQSVNQYVSVSSPPWACEQTLFPVRKLLFFYLCGAPSLTRGRVCHLSVSVCSNLSVWTLSMYI